jgi:hypothetical protein
MLRRINPSPGIEGKAFAIAKAGHEALLVVGSVLNRDCGENVETRAAQGWIGTRPAAQITNRRIDPNDGVVSLGIPARREKNWDWRFGIECAGESST